MVETADKRSRGRLWPVEGEEGGYTGICPAKRELYFYGGRV